MTAEARLCEDKASKAMVDAARMADELRSEQEGAQNIEKNRRLGEAQVKDMQARLDESETNALKGGKKAMNKLETRIRELESEMDAEGRRFADAQKNLRKSERRIQELTFAADEDRKLLELSFSAGVLILLLLESWSLGSPETDAKTLMEQIDLIW